MPKKAIKYALIAALILIVIVPLLVYLFSPQSRSFFSTGPEISCPDEVCFISTANECGNARMQKSIEGSTFEFSTIGCTLTKNLMRVSPEEPAEIRELLEGKAMECEYTRSQFDNNTLDSLMAGSENCEGELGDAIADLIGSI